MREHTVETLLARYDRLQEDVRFDEWRSLCHDVLTTLVEQQGLVISLQRRTLESQPIQGAERSALRVRADAAFTVVQRLHQLRRKVHALLTDKRTAGTTEESKYTATALRAAG